MDSTTAPSVLDKRPLDTPALPADKKIKKSLGTVVTAGAPVAPVDRTSTSSTTAVGTTVLEKGPGIEALPTVAIRHIRSFADQSSLSGACRFTLEALPRLHFKVNMWADTREFDGDSFGGAAKGHMGLRASGDLATGRVVTRITITNVGDSEHLNDDLEPAIKTIVRSSITTLREITISGGNNRYDGRATRVAHILGELVPLSAKRQRVAPSLARVNLVAGANAVARAGKAVAAGLWPALETLTFSHCRANAKQFAHLANAMSNGLAPRLRVLNWDDQSCIRKNAVDDVLLAALSRGQCPLVERLSFTRNHFCPENRIDRLFDALRACPNLLELRMDCSRRPHLQLQDLARALEAGHVPRLELLYVRATAPYYRQSDVELKRLRRAAASREPPVELESKIKTRLRG